MIRMSIKASCDNCDFRVEHDGLVSRVETLYADMESFRFEHDRVIDELSHALDTRDAIIERLQSELKDMRRMHGSVGGVLHNYRGCVRGLEKSLWGVDINDAVAQMARFVRRVYADEIEVGEVQVDVIRSGVVISEEICEEGVNHRRFMMKLP